MKENGGKNERQTGTGISRLYLLLAMLALVWTLKTCVPAVDTAITKIAGAAQKTKTVQAFSALTFQSTGDPIADLHEDLAAEQKARLTYDNILRFTDDADVRDPIRFLRAREITHFQRFGDALRIVQDNLDAKNFYAYNPAFDKG